MNDSELVQRLRRRDPAAMQWLCDCYLPSLWRFVYTRVNGDRHLAEDITNETILAMLTTVQSQLENPGEAEILNPAGWLRTVAARRISDHFRAAARVHHLLQQSPYYHSESDSADPAKQHELQETQIEVRNTMDNLPEQYRLALEWKYLDKLSVREIAARWEMTEKAAESILFRARREFRDRMAKQQLAGQSSKEQSSKEQSPRELPPTVPSPVLPSHNGKRFRPLESTPDEAAPNDAAHKSK